jgi:hypothetical protein
VREAGNDRPAQVKRAFALALCRAPKAAEIELAERFLMEQQRQIEADLAAANQPTADAAQRALAAFCQVIFNSNEFVYQQ